MKKTFCLLLAGLLMITGFILPVFTCAEETTAEEYPEGFDPFGENQLGDGWEWESDPYGETPPEEEKNDDNSFDQADDAWEWDNEPYEETPSEAEKKSSDSFVKGYIVVPAGLTVYWDADLTVSAGFFTKSGNLYVEAVSENSLRGAFYDDNIRMTRIVYLPKDQVTLLPSSAVAAMNNALRRANAEAHTYNGHSLYTLPFYVAPKTETPRTPAPEPALPEDSGEESEEEPRETEPETQEPMNEEPEIPEGIMEQPAENEPEAQEPVVEEPEVPEVIAEEPAEIEPEVLEPEEENWTAAPTDLNAVLADDGASVILSWVGNGTNAAVRVYELLGDSGNMLGDVNEGETFTTEALTPGEHTFFVRTVRGDSFGLASDYVSVLVPADWKAAPTDLAAFLSEDGTTVVLTWTGNGAASSYSVYEKLPDSTKARLLGTTDETCSFTTKPLNPGDHSFLVRSKEGDAYGAFSAAVSITVPPHWKAAPTELTADLSEDGTAVVLTWTGNGIVNSYRVYEKLPDSNKARLVGTIEDAETFTTDALEPGEHTFLVKTFLEEDSGIFSESVTITVPER